MMITATIIFMVLLSSQPFLLCLVGHYTFQLPVGTGISTLVGQIVSVKIISVYG